MTAFGLRQKSLFLLGAALIISRSAAFPQSQNIPAQQPKFDVASIRLNTSNRGWRMEFIPDGVRVEGATLKYVIQDAYGIYDDRFWSGGPAWINTRRFDIEAKFDVSQFPNITLEQRRSMLQQLLADRFKLAVHHETKQLSVYALEIGKNGPKLQETKSNDILHSDVYGAQCLGLQGRSGYMKLQGCSMTDFAAHLNVAINTGLGYMVIDKTGVKGRYDIELRWAPETGAGSTPADSSAPEIFTALQEQLGLKLIPSKAPLDTMVIDHVEMPSEN